MFTPSTTAEKYFANISRIPRASTREKAVSDYVMDTARALGLKCRQDALGNVVVFKPASPGREGEAAVMLQAHLDMVTVKEPDSDHDFDFDPLQLYVDEKGCLRAKGTTLGADDGYGCAYILAALEEEFSHPPLECVFTVQEENGCYGAQGLDMKDITARRMIGLDVMGSDIENTLCVSCYCSDRLTVEKSFATERMTGDILTLSLTGVQPVRVGALVHPEQGNAVKMMARLITSLGRDARLARLTGGEAENYNPVQCEAVLVFQAPCDRKAVEQCLTDILHALDGEVNEGTQHLKITLNWQQGTAAAPDKKTARDLLMLTDLVPSGTTAISPLDGSMIATNNLGLIDLNETSFRMVMSDRARDKGCLDGINRRVKALCDVFGCVLKVESRYVPWPLRADSPLLKKTSGLMELKWGTKTQTNICPGGLEICDFLPKVPDLDCVMFAPIGGECHSVMEWMDLKSFNRMYAFLKDLLAIL